ncbi:NAD(P)-dependent oxidoreductase [Chryseobacterium gregarium]|uniref:NAD(P)-dependent oxidoreductase n=1 Tax=Chryseobacterium gregarium TaxID=456299 RepID=UPI00040B6F58|nr:NAD(P)-dependent oxidoreductase [Chryseobacterium gregarium]
MIRSNRNDIALMEMKTIGILYPGDMGAAIAEILLKNKFRVVTAGAGRSLKTLNHINRANIEDLQSLEKVIDESDILLSVNSPNKSIEIAEEAARYMGSSQKHRIFVDLNSNTPEAAVKIEQLFSLKNTSFINGAVLGSSKDMEKDSVMVLSGRHRELMITMLDGMFNIKDAGGQTASASAYKLLFSLVNKGINAVFFETMAAASHYGILDELNSSLEQYLPGTYLDLMKTTPTYTDHTERRMHEMKGLAEMQRASGLPDYISSAAAETFAMVNHSGIFKNAAPSTVLETFQLFKKLNRK